MKTEFKSSFAKDLRSIKNQTIDKRVAELIEMVEEAADQGAIPHLKKLRESVMYYRVRLGEYRVGLTIKSGVVTFVRCLHRKEICRYFP